MTRTRLGFALGSVCLFASFLLFAGANPLSAFFASAFSPNQELPLPNLAPIGGPDGPVSFVVRGLEPSTRADEQGGIYVSSIRGVPGGVDLHRWSPLVDPPPNSDGTLPFKYEGQPDNCGILTNGCANNLNNMLNPGVAPGGGDVDIAPNAPDPITNIPNLPLVSLLLAPGVTGTHSTDRGDSFSPPNVLEALISGDDRQWIESTGTQTVYMNYHDVATFNIEVQRSSDGGTTYNDGFGEAIDPQNLLATAGIGTQTGNTAGTIRIDKSSCSSKGNLYEMFVAPDNATENATGMPQRSVYVGVSSDVNLGLPVFTFTDHKVFTSPLGTLGATNGANQIFPALAVDNLGFVYAVWSDNSNIWFSSSSDQGNTWTAPIRINQGATVGNANVFPWVAADANGHVDIVWFGDDRPGNSNDRATLEPGHPASQGAACTDGTNTCMTKWAQWSVYMAESVNAHAASPLFVQSVVSDHVIHRGTISTGGLGGGADRGLADLFQVALDPQHRANIAFSDDHKVHPLCAQLGSGACGADDPQSTRLTRANFTRQLKTTAGIVATGVCSAGGPPETGHKITGKGQMGSSVNFGFIAKDSPMNGALQYQDSGANLNARSSNGVTSVVFNGNCATFNGNAKVNNNPGYTYSVTACDNGDPGAGKDSFSISLSGANFSYNNGGTITEGNIKMQ